MDELEAVQYDYEPGMPNEALVPGVYFRPSETLLIDGFLEKKLLRHPLPSEKIKEIPFLYDYPPELLPLCKFSSYLNVILL